MSIEKFDLVNYTRNILDIASSNSCSEETALMLFIQNLSTMCEHHKGAVGVDYRKLGQRWNSLTSNEKVAQKREVLSRLTRRASERSRSK